MTPDWRLAQPSGRLSTGCPQTISRRGDLPVLGDQTAEGKLFFANGVPSGETVKTSFDTEFHTVRAGLNYRFHGQNEPLK